MAGWLKGTQHAQVAQQAGAALQQRSTHASGGELRPHHHTSAAAEAAPGVQLRPLLPQLLLLLHLLPPAQAATAAPLLLALLPLRLLLLPVQQVAACQQRQWSACGAVGVTLHVGRLHVWVQGQHLPLHPPVAAPDDKWVCSSAAEDAAGQREWEAWEAANSAAVLRTGTVLAGHLCLPHLPHEGRLQQM